MFDENLSKNIKALAYEKSIDVERVFKAFYTTKAKGMGVGLSISRSIVEAHHGRLWASRGTRIGAVFHLLLPPAGAQEKAAQIDAPRAAKSAQQA